MESATPAVFRVLVSSVLCFSILSCANDKRGPVDMYVYGLDSPGVFKIHRRRVETIQSVMGGRGSVTALIEKATVDQDANSVEGGSSVSILFFEQDGAIVGADLESLMLLSYYQHLEAAVDYFHAHGVETAGFVPLSSYVRPNLGQDAELRFTDNAAYSPTIHAFILPESFFLSSGVPLPANDGVITHEFTHAVFHFLLNGTSHVPREIAESWPTAAQNYLAGLNEGLADVHGAMLTGDPNFILPSFPAIGSDRDASVPKDLTSGLKSAAESGFGFDPHALGAVVAAAAWQIAATLGRDRTADLAIAAVRAMRDTYSPSFKISDYLNLFVAGAQPSEQAPICAVFVQRFALVRSEITTCP